MTHLLEQTQVASPELIHPDRHARDLANEHVMRFVHQAIRACVPDRIYWCNGSPYERAKLLEQAAHDGVLIPLDAEQWPGCTLYRSHSNDDVARGEHRTFVCTPPKDTARPTNDRASPTEACGRLADLFEECMRGRTMYVVPFLRGSVGSPSQQVGVQITDSIDVVLSMGVTTRIGDVALRALGESDQFTRCLHGLGRPATATPAAAAAATYS